MPDSQSNPPAAKALPWYGVVAAFVLLAVFLWMTYYMFFVYSAENDPHWKNALLVYNSFLAFATAAAGLLLGTTIQQTRVAAAETAATKAKGERDEAQSKVKQVKQELNTEDDAGPAGAAAKLARLRAIVS